MNLKLCNNIKVNLKIITSKLFINPQSLSNALAPLMCYTPGLLVYEVHCAHACNCYRHYFTLHSEYLPHLLLLSYEKTQQKWLVLTKIILMPWQLCNKIIVLVIISHFTWIMHSDWIKLVLNVCYNIVIVPEGI